MGYYSAGSGLANPMTTAADRIKGGVAGAFERQAAADWQTDVQAAGNMVLIETITLGSDGAFQFAAIPATYRHLYVTLTSRGSAAQTNVGINVNFNNDTTSGNYAYQRIVLNGSDFNYTGWTASDTKLDMGSTFANSATAYLYGDCAFEIRNYASTSWKKNIRGHGNAPGIYCIQVSGQWLYVDGEGKPVAITEIDIVAGTGSFLTGSTATLYGVR